MKYIGISLVILLSSILISCNGKSQEKVVLKKGDVFVDSINYQKNPCPIFQLDENIKQMEQNLDKIKIELLKQNGK